MSCRSKSSVQIKLRKHGLRTFRAGSSKDPSAGARCLEKLGRWTATRRGSSSGTTAKGVQKTTAGITGQWYLSVKKIVAF